MEGIVKDVQVVEKVGLSSQSGGKTANVIADL